MGEIGSSSTPHTRYQYKFRIGEWTEYKDETLNKLREHRIVYLSDLWDREDFINKQELENEI